MEVVDLQKFISPTPQPTREPIVGKTHLADGWVYRNIPATIKPKVWNEILEIMGEGNYFILAVTKDREWASGQFLISPMGMSNLKAFHDEHGG